MDIITIAGVAIISAAISVLLKQYKPEYALIINLSAGILIMLFVVTASAPIVSEIRALVSQTGISGEYIGILIKALGICFITQLAADICRDSGAASIAAKVETAGKIAVLLAAMPLFKRILDVARSLIAAT
ncbi:MAG: SpoIIIAC/SpoIIIAD family protein [Acetanaerobacterium sp.]